MQFEFDRTNIQLCSTEFSNVLHDKFPEYERWYLMHRLSKDLINLAESENCSTRFCDQIGVYLANQVWESRFDFA